MSFAAFVANQVCSGSKLIADDRMRVCCLCVAYTSSSSRLCANLKAYTVAWAKDRRVLNHGSPS